ncbi:MAG: iron ABC transporter permease [Treponema sp.]|jgi:iron complex transport system permease protein|nr:iron ABC transporter permease [Treponema sp.]
MIPKPLSGGTGKYLLVMIVSTVLLVALITASLCTGRYVISVMDVLRALGGQSATATIRTVVWQVRLPRILMAAVVGAGLSTAGVGLQAMFGNPLVSTHTLGISSSAGFGAALGLLLFSNHYLVQLLAALFGFLALGLIYTMSRSRGSAPNILMLVLSGVIIGSIFDALTSLIKYVADPEEQLPVITYWLMGSLAGISLVDVARGAPIILGAIAVLWLLRWRLNVVSLREDEAISMGINIPRTRALILFSTTVIAAVTVSFCGIISFVGLAVPHFTRMITGNDHRYLLPASALMGASFMVIIDTAARSATAAEIPLSVLTATIGGPIFVVLLRKTGGAWNGKG